MVRLLESVEENSSGIKVEVMLILHVAKDDVARFTKDNVTGATLIQSSEQVNVLETLNYVVAKAHGEFFAVLNPLFLLQPNWLSSLLTEINEDRRIGIVTGKVLSIDGLLDEAGIFLDSEFHFHSYGKSDFPERPKYNFKREIECASVSSNLVRKSDFDNSGGFDVRQSSLSIAFCKLSLSFRQKLQKSILYIPQAKIVNYGVESNAEMFDVSLPLDGMDEDLIVRSSDKEQNARVLLNSKNVLFIDIGLPEYDRDSGSLRAFYLIKLLNSLRYHVIVVPRKGQVATPYLEELISIGIEVLYVFPDRKGMMKELRDLLPSVDLAWICRPQLNVEFEWIFKVNPQIKWIYDTIDLHFVRLAREAELSNSKKLKRKSVRFKKLEFSIAQKADLTLTVTEDEKKILEDLGVKKVAVIPNIHETHQHNNFPGFFPREGLLFIGSYHHPPNVDAVKWLIEEIMPIVWKKFRISVTLLGDAPDKEVKALESELVKVPGYVKDVEPYFTSHRFFVAPLRYGAGMKGKIGQSLAYKLPIVTTSIGAEGIGLTHGLDVLIANDKESFAQQIINAYEDEKLWQNLSYNSGKVLNNYSPDRVREKLQTIFEGLV
ncbi:glycosyltransferase [Algoriphagus sp. Y33]|uniref:glycosyltransferase n=1 Tax=Algoriphagus sp. Y33 TaxID=2772483 RepID=UPI001786B756|nr:glycosyltransferase [Algoriphagus sp. Y33]